MCREVVNKKINKSLILISPLYHLKPWRNSRQTYRLKKEKYRVFGNTARVSPQRCHWGAGCPEYSIILCFGYSPHTAMSPGFPWACSCLARWDTTQPPLWHKVAMRDCVQVNDTAVELIWVISLDTRLHMCLCFFLCSFLITKNRDDRIEAIFEAN